MNTCIPTTVPFAESWLHLIRSSVRSDVLDNFFIPFTYLGGPWFYLAAALIMLSIRYRRLYELASLLAVSTLINALLKNMLIECRPFTVEHLIFESGYSFPSGHAQASAVFWGFLALKSNSNLNRAGCILFLLLMAFSRPYLGVHYVHDVVMGTLIGLSIVVLHHAFLKRGVFSSALSHVRRKYSQ